jgi:uncharacterized protein YjbI with pentapeptide repeats
MPQDFSGQNLRGRSFKGQNLAGGNFSYADIRGADFSGANLIGANFKRARAGLRKRWAIFIIIFSWLWSGLLGFYWFIFGYLVSRIFDAPKLGNQIAGWVSLSILIAFFLLTIYQGIKKSSEIVLLIVALALGLAIPFGYGGTLAICCGIIGIFISIFSFIGAFAFVFFKAGSTALTITSSVAVTLALFNIYVAWRTIKGDEKYSLIRNIAIFIATKGSTNFYGANLTNADFTQAWLKSTDFRKAVLISTYWFHAKMLDRVCPGKTYLQNTQLHQLLITGEGQDKNFDYEPLRGINLKGASLQDASFIGADLSEANLQDANLSRAKLVQARLDSTDFTGATLTGAYIEDWGITTDTNFDGVRCEYVYMRLPTAYNPDPHRKPDNRQEVFADGEFGDFIKPIFDTLDLYHSQGVDPRAIAISFKQLAENHPDAGLEIVAMEKRGQDKFLLRAKTAVTADKSELSAEYFTTYNQLKALAEQEVQKLIAEKDSRITDLQNMVVTALQRPSFYAQTYQNQGDTIMAEASKKQSNFDLKGAQFAGGLVNADTVNANQIGGNITNYNSEQKQNLAEAAAEIQQLLNQLGQTYPTNTPLEKQVAVTEALKQIDNNPTLKARVIGALKSGGTEALKELVDHPLVNILLATLEGWQDAE